MDRATCAGDTSFVAAAICVPPALTGTRDSPDCLADNDFSIEVRDRWRADRATLGCAGLKVDTDGDIPGSTRLSGLTHIGTTPGMAAFTASYADEWASVCRISCVKTAEPSAPETEAKRSIASAFT